MGSTKCLHAGLLAEVERSERIINGNGNENENAHMQKETDTV